MTHPTITREISRLIDRLANADLTRQRRDPHTVERLRFLLRNRHDTPAIVAGLSWRIHHARKLGWPTQDVAYPA